jgi:hypothetical protein
VGHSPYADAWAHFDFNLGLTADLLPVVADPWVQISPNSTMKSKGKTPSIVNGGGMAAGIPKWTAKATLASEVDRWAADPRLGICIQTRRVRAIDIDIGDPQFADLVERHLRHHLGELPARVRANSGKRLLAFIAEGDLFKRAWKGEGGLIEFLATGQQFVAAGPHYDSRTGEPSGADYHWRDGLPEFPVMDAERVMATLEAVAAEIGFERVGRDGAEAARRREQDLGLADERLDWLLASEWPQHGFDRNGALMIDCPWKGNHSTQSGVTETVYFPAGTNGYEQGHYRCLHAGCSGRTDYEFDVAIGLAADDFEDLTAIPDEPDAQPERKRLSAIPADDFALRPPPRWIVKDIVPEAQLGVVYGASGSGKSFLVLDLAAAVARGIFWREHRVRQMKVVYVCAEGAGGFRNRVAAYRHQHGIVFGDTLHVIADQPNFLGSDDAKTVSAEIRRVGAGLAVIDTLAQVTPGGDENSAVDMGKAIRKCRQISEQTGCMVLLVHHSGKDAARGARGWSGIRAAADVELEVSLLKNGVRALKVTKQKDGRDDLAFGFSLEAVPIGQDEDGDLIESCVIVEADLPREDEAGQGARGEPKTKIQRLVWSTYQMLVETDGGADALAVFEAASATVAEQFGHSRKNSRDTVVKALTALQKIDADGFAWLIARDGRLYGDDIT